MDTELNAAMLSVLSTQIGQSMPVILRQGKGGIIPPLVGEFKDVYYFSRAPHYVEKLDFYVRHLQAGYGDFRALADKFAKGGNNVFVFENLPFANLLLRVSVFQLPFIAHILYGLDLRLDPGQFRRQAV